MSPHRLFMKQYPYPEAPPACQQPDTLAERCDGCPFTECGYLALAQELQDSYFDTVVPNFYTQKGLEVQIENDPELAEEIRSGRAGLLFIDVRGLKWANDNLGDETMSGYDRGDQLLQICGARLAKAGEGKTGVRIGVAPRAGEHQSPRPRDLGFRGGKQSDELILLIRDITGTGLEEIKSRVELEFSPSKAAEDSKAGRLPIVASVAAMHVLELDHVERDTPIDAFRALYSKVKINHDNLKPAQYVRMFDMIRDNTPSEDTKRAIDEIPDKDKISRNTIRYFYNVVCREFMQDPGAYFDRALNELGYNTAAKE